VFVQKSWWIGGSHGPLNSWLISRHEQVSATAVPGESAPCGTPLPVSKHLERQTHEKEDREHFRHATTMRADSNGDGQRPENRA
jgi:hypothetical protein